MAGYMLPILAVLSPRQRVGKVVWHRPTLLIILLPCFCTEGRFRKDGSESMMPSHACTGRLAALALIMGLSGCGEFAPQRLGSLRRSSDAEEGPPKASAALRIPNAPSTAKPNLQGQVEQATFVKEPEAAAADPYLLENPLRVLYQRAAQRHALMDSYIFRLKRREVVNGRKQPEELVKVHLRREPYSVHLVWLGKEGKGREAIYVKGKYKNEMQLLLAAGDIFPFSPGGMRYNIA